MRIVVVLSPDWIPTGIYVRSLVAVRLDPRDKKLDWLGGGSDGVEWNNPDDQTFLAAVGRPTAIVAFVRSGRSAKAIFAFGLVQTSPPITLEGRKEGRFLKKGLIGLPLPRVESGGKRTSAVPPPKRRSLARLALGPARKVEPRVTISTTHDMAVARAIGRAKGTARIITPRKVIIIDLENRTGRCTALHCSRSSLCPSLSFLPVQINSAPQRRSRRRSRSLFEAWTADGQADADDGHVLTKAENEEGADGGRQTDADGRRGGVSERL